MSRVRPTPTSRSVPEWIGRTPDSKPPAHIRARIFDAHGGRDYITGQKIMPGDVWVLDHIKALALGGENRESNLAPVLVETNRRKAADETSLKAKADRIRQKHIGAYSKSRRLIPGSRGTCLRKRMDGTVERRT